MNSSLTKNFCRKKTCFSLQTDIKCFLLISKRYFLFIYRKKGKRRFAKICFLYDLPVPGHEDQGKDGDVGRDVDDVLDCPAPGQTEGPEHDDVVTRRGRDTDQYEEEISHSKVQDQQVCGVLHLGVSVDLAVGLSQLWRN